MIRPDAPSGSDVSALLAGRFLPPDRLPAAWRLLECWLAALAWGTWGTSLSSGALTGLDFDLARAGVSSRYGLAELVSDDLALPLRRAPGLSAGQVSADRAAALARAWRPAVPELAATHRPMAEDLLAWFDRLPGWSAAAAASHRPAPDVITVMHFGPPTE